ncbi:unnamed protein product [Closterium sp. NIES-65]|nr:unnamed protein product [Closterium sp. NIES-65]
MAQPSHCRSKGIGGKVGTEVTRTLVVVAYAKRILVRSLINNGSSNGVCEHLRHNTGGPSASERREWVHFCYRACELHHPFLLAKIRKKGVRGREGESKKIDVVAGGGQGELGGF